jgi:hypothetical protein
MKRELLRTFVGVLVIVTHIISFIGLIVIRKDYIPQGEHLDVAMVLIPVSAAYFMAIVRSAIQLQDVFSSSQRVNMNYVVVVILVTLSFCIALLYFVYRFPDIGGPTTVELKRWLIVLEIAFGSSFGLIAEDLFGKIERINVDNN